MAGSLTISTLNNDTGVLATQNGMNGIAKAWVNFGYVSSAITVRGSFNISSVVRNTAGSYTINITTAMPNANYAVCTGVTNSLTNVNTANNVDNFTTTSFTWQHLENNANTDTTVMCASIFSS